MMLMKEFAKFVIAYQKKLSCTTSVPKSLKLDGEMEKKRKNIVRSFLIARNLYHGGHGTNLSNVSELEAGAEFLENHHLTDRSLEYISGMNRNLWHLRTCQG